MAAIIKAKDWKTRETKGSGVDQRGMMLSCFNGGLSIRRIVELLT